jgi:signal transduction histidine kinase
VTHDAQDLRFLGETEKDDLLVRASHELRAPLASLLVWLGALKQHVPETQAVREAFAAIAEAARQHQRIVADLVDLVNGRTRRLTLIPETVDLDRLVGEVVRTHRPEAWLRDIRLELAGSSGGAGVWGDPDRLRQIAVNLISNAVKFGRRGGRVDVRVEDGEDTVALIVRDDGIGIASSRIPSLFEPFRRPEERPGDGLGVGLAIVKQLVELHHGTVAAASDGEGRGATFTVRLPRAEPAFTVDRG